jgi:hypothetical protein
MYSLLVSLSSRTSLHVLVINNQVLIFGMELFGMFCWYFFLAFVYVPDFEFGSVAAEQCVGARRFYDIRCSKPREPEFNNAGLQGEGLLPGQGQGQMMNNTTATAGASGVHVANYGLRLKMMKGKQASGSSSSSSAAPHPVRRRPCCQLAAYLLMNYQSPGRSLARPPPPPSPRSSVHGHAILGEPGAQLRDQPAAAHSGAALAEQGPGAALAARPRVLLLLRVHLVRHGAGPRAPLPGPRLADGSSAAAERQGGGARARRDATAARRHRGRDLGLGRGRGGRRSPPRRRRR